MNLPPQFIPHLDHRITVLMSFTIRRDIGFFGADHGEARTLGDTYRGSLEGAGIMLRMLLEFVGVKASGSTPPCLVRSSDARDTILGQGSLALISPVDISKVPLADQAFLARMHSEASKRTAHPAFGTFTVGLDPDDLRRATKWVVKEIWNRCYQPDPIIVHGDPFSMLPGGKWESIPFQPAR